MEDRPGYRLKEFILLVDDSITDCELITVALKDTNRDIVCINNGKEALEFIFCTGKYSDRPKYNCRAMILDLHINGFNGLSLMQKIRAGDDTFAIPIVVFSSSEFSRDVEQAYGHGVNSFVVKPVSFDDFIRTVQQIDNYWMTVNRHLAVSIKGG